jgi:hypothetical protein
MVLTALLPPVATGQPAAFRVSKATLADVQQDTLQAVDGATGQATEVFPGTYVSPFGEALVRRIENLRGRVDEADRNALTASKAEAGFDRSILSWRAHPAGRTVALALRYFRDPLWKLGLEVTDDYGRAEAIDPARYDYFAIAVCSRSEAAAWTCTEERLADVAGRHQANVPQDPSERIAVAEKLLERVLAGK